MWLGKDFALLLRWLCWLFGFFCATDVATCSLHYYSECDHQLVSCIQIFKSKRVQHSSIYSACEMVSPSGSWRRKWRRGQLHPPETYLPCQKCSCQKFLAKNKKFVAKIPFLKFFTPTSPLLEICRCLSENGSFLPSLTFSVQNATELISSLAEKVICVRIKVGCNASPTI